jgi:hypothetical protein
MIVMNLRCIALMSETSGITAALLPQAELWRVLEKAQIKRFVARKFREVEDSPLQTRRLKNFQEFPRIVNNCKESTYSDILRHTQTSLVPVLFLFQDSLGIWHPGHLARLI